MNTQEKIVQLTTGKTNQQLLEMLAKPQDWTLLALDAARDELLRRNIPIPPVAQIQTNEKSANHAPASIERRLLLGVFLPLVTLIGAIAIDNTFRHRLAGAEGGFEQLGRGIATVAVLIFTLIMNFIAACMPIRSLDSLLFFTFGSVSVGALLIIFS